MNEHNILVTGATGQLGSRIVQQLLRTVPPANVIAAGRKAEKAPRGVAFRTLDYDNPASVAAALARIERVVLVSGTDVGRRVAQHQAVIDAAARANVELIAYTSILRAKENPLQLAAEHRATEAVLEASGVPFIRLRNGWYTENYLGSAGAAIQFGVLQSASGEGRISAAPRDDYAEAAAVLIQRDNHRPGQAYELAGSTSFSKRELAGWLSRRHGKHIVVQGLTEPQYAAALGQAGLPPAFAAILADSDARSGEGWLFDDSRTLEHVIGRPTTPFERTLDAGLAAS